MILSAYFVGLILSMVRLSGFFVVMPIFGAKNVPARIKVGMVFFISYILLPILDLKYVIIPESFLSLIGMVTVEFLIGLFVGMVFAISLSCVYLLGGIIDRNIGFSMVSVVNPMGTQQLPVSANLFYIMALMVFFTINGHHHVLRVISQTYEFAPLGVGVFKIQGVWELVWILQKSFVLGFQLAAPFVITIFVGNMLLGLLAKAMPGMNVFILGMPFKIAIGLFLFVALTPLYIKSLIEVFLWIWDNFMRIFVYLK